VIVAGRIFFGEFSAAINFSAAAEGLVVLDFCRIYFNEFTHTITLRGKSIG